MHFQLFVHVVLQNDAHFQLNTERHTITAEKMHGVLYEVVQAKLNANGMHFQLEMHVVLYEDMHPEVFVVLQNGMHLPLFMLQRYAKPAEQDMHVVLQNDMPKQLKTQIVLYNDMRLPENIRRSIEFSAGNVFSDGSAYHSID